MTTPQLTTTGVAEVSVKVTGDIGGAGISRFRFIRNDAGVITVADCNAAGAAVKGLYSTTTLWPSGVVWAVQPAVEVFQIDNALVQGFLTMSTVPTPVTGTGGSVWAAGIGARINWKTATVSGRRLLKGSTYMVPLVSNAFGTSGAVAGTTVTSLSSAASAYFSAMTAAALTPVIWHRPLKGATTGGLIGPINAAVVNSTPAGLRSRRS